MSVFDRLAPLIPQVSASSRQKKEPPSVCLSPPLSLPSPVIKKKPIQIPSFNEKGLVCEKHDRQQINTDRSFVPISSSMKSSQPSWNKLCQHSQINHGERASTLPRAKPKTYSSPTVSEKPSISIFPAPKPNSFPTLKPKPSDSLHLSASQLSDPSPLMHQPQSKLSISPTLTIPTPRLSPSPTSLCQGISLDSREGKQPSPIAKERRARSITISNTKVEPDCSKQRSSKETKYDVLDQEALMDFTHPALRRACSMTSKVSRHQTYSESQRQAATSQNSNILQGKDGFSKKENSSKDKPTPLPRDMDISAIPKPKAKSKQQEEILPSEATGTHTSLSESEGIKFANVVRRDSQSVFDGRVTHSSFNLHRRCLDYSQRRTAGLASNDQSYVQMYSERRSALPLTRKTSFSTEPLLNQSTVSPNSETRRGRFGFNNETRADTTFLSGSSLRRPQEENNIQKNTGTSWKLSQQTSTSQNICVEAQSQMDVKSALNPSSCILKDYNCQSRDIDRKMQVPQCTHRLNQFKTCLAASQTEEASRSASIESTTSKTTSSKLAIISHKHWLDHKQSPGQSKSHKEVNLSDTGLNQTDIFAPSDHHGVYTELPENPSEKCIVSCPFNTNCLGISSKGVFDLPQQRVHQRPDEITTTTASQPPHQLNPSPVARAFIMEEPEDPYYVTMYYPGSVYVGEYRDIQTTWKTPTEHIAKRVHEGEFFICHL